MTFACPNSDQHPVKLTDRACPVCGFPLTVSALLAYYLRRAGERLTQWLRQATALRCPGCQNANPIYARQCAHCGTPITVQATARVSLGPPRRGLQRLIQATPVRALKFAVQAAYLSFSLWLLHRYLLRIPILTGELPVLLVGVAVTTFLVLGLILLGAWLLPPTILAGFHRQASWLTKLAALSNALTLLAVLVLYAGNWWLPSAVLAGLLGIVYVAALIITRVLWPTATELTEVFQHHQAGTFDPSKPQGRKGYTT